VQKSGVTGCDRTDADAGKTPEAAMTATTHTLQSAAGTTRA
jgi:hypothetical protein